MSVIVGANVFMVTDTGSGHFLLHFITRSKSNEFCPVFFQSNLNQFEILYQVFQMKPNVSPNPKNEVQEESSRLSALRGAKQREQC